MEKTRNFADRNLKISTERLSFVG